MSWCVYILKCADESLYTGITNNLDDRLKAHQEGQGAKYTRARLPFILVHTEHYPDRSQASRREYAIKSMSRSEKLALIGGI